MEITKLEQTVSDLRANSDKASVLKAAIQASGGYWPQQHTASGVFAVQFSGVQGFGRSPELAAQHWLEQAQAILVSAAALYWPPKQQSVQAQHRR